jgi:malate dehydrogenase (oxaloacetate-decarboxylating)(NADP+)
MTRNTRNHPTFAYHANPTPGKLKIRPSKPIRTLNDLGLAYTPYVADVCLAIADNPDLARHYTGRHTTVAVISNGTAVLGLGNIGALASKPVMEGKSALFYRFGGVQSIDIEINENDPEKFVDTVARLAPSFGAINLEDIKAPDCFMIEQKLREKMDIPIFHDDQHGTAVVVTAALINALHLKNLPIEHAKCVVLGAGSAAIACLNMFTAFGMRKDNIILCDSKGVVHTKRTDLTPEKQAYANTTECRTFDDALHGADILIGLSKPGIIQADALRSMAERPIVFPLSNPQPEISPEDIRSVHPDAFIGTGQSGRPNQINNLLCFPYIFRGCLDAGSTVISEDMKKACVMALAMMARTGFTDTQGIYPDENIEFGPDYLIPYALDPMVRIMVPPAVAKASDGRAQTTPLSMPEYQRQLAAEAFVDRPIIGAAVGQKNADTPKRIWYVIKGNTAPDSVVSAAQYMARYDIASVGLITDNADIATRFRAAPCLANITVQSELPADHHHDGCIYVGSDVPDSDTLTGGYIHNGLTLSAPKTPPEFIQRALAVAGCDIDWTCATDTSMRIGASCLFVQGTWTPDQCVIGALRIDDPCGVQWVDAHDTTVNVVEKSCFVLCCA